MGNSEQTMLLVSDDATLCATARREFEARITGLRVATVSSVAAARRILEGNSPAVILLEEAEDLLGFPGRFLDVPVRVFLQVAAVSVYVPVLHGFDEFRFCLKIVHPSGFRTHGAGGCLDVWYTFSHCPTIKTESRTFVKELFPENVFGKCCGAGVPPLFSRARRRSLQAGGRRHYFFQTRYEILNLTVLESGQ